jgi:oxalate---CoA ligase
MSDGELNDFWSVFSALAARVGEVEAILAPGRTSLRFAELPSRLEDIRAALHRFGIGRGDRVVVALPRGPDMAVCYLGVAACATFVPLNPEYTEDEFRHCLGRLHPKVVLVGKGHGEAIRSAASKLGIATVDLIPVDSAPAGTFILEGSGTAAAREPEWASAEDIALILLTSGTTSAQKLVPMKHRHVLAYARGMEKALGLGSADRCLHVVPMFHGHGLKSSLLSPLVLGGGVICPATVDVASIFAAMKALRPTWYSANHTIQHAIADAIDRDRDAAKGANLRFIIAGAGRIDPKAIGCLEEAFGAPVVESYSMSETGNLTSSPLPPRIRKRGTVGVAMFNEVRIIDGAGAFLGPHQQGEVVARGPGVFDGYLDDAAANAEAFVDGWFRTGDLGRFDDDGYLTLAGRLKEMINRGGEKIAPLEVENVLAEYPAVGRVCVFGIPHPTLGEEVVASVIPAETGQASEGEIIAFARGRLAAFKVPRRIFFTIAFPTGATGKVDRRALARICAGSLVPAAGLEADGIPSPIEADVAALWQAVLNARAVRVDQNFFLAGGDSLKAAQLFAQIRERFGVALALRHIFEGAATVAGMARLIERARHNEGGGVGLPDCLIPLKTDGTRPPLFAVPSQGHPACFIDLARLIDSKQPLYGLQSPGLDGKYPPLDQVEDLAADSIAGIRTIQRHGPYYLAGTCFGGLVAYEMARQLDAAGEHVALLILLDPSAPFADRQGRRRRPRPVLEQFRIWTRLPRFVLRRLQIHTREMIGRKGTGRRAFFREKLDTLRSIAGQPDLFRGIRRELRQTAVVEANHAAAQRYVPRPYHGPTILCLAGGQPVAGRRDDRLGWLALVPQASSEYVPGHDSGAILSPPHVSVLAGHVNAWLSQVHARRESVSGHGGR